MPINIQKKVLKISQKDLFGALFWWSISVSHFCSTNKRSIPLFIRERQYITVNQVNMAIVKLSKTFQQYRVPLHEYFNTKRIRFSFVGQTIFSGTFNRQRVIDKLPASQDLVPLISMIGNRLEPGHNTFLQSKRHNGGIPVKHLHTCLKASLAALDSQYPIC